MHMQGCARGGRILLALAVFGAACTQASDPIHHESMLFGTFQVAQVGVDDATHHPLADAFAVRFDGGGGVFGDPDGNGVEEPVGAYTVKADRGFSMPGAGSAGILNRTAEVLLTGKLAGTPNVNIGVAVRTSRGIGPAALSGYYVACVAGGDLQTGRSWTRRMILHGDGVSHIDWTILADSDGAAGAGGYDYEVLDGEVTVRAAGAVRYVGAVRFDGSILALTMRPHAGDPRGEILVAVRQSFANGDAAFAGDYAGYSFTSRLAGAGLAHATSALEVDADGRGRVVVRSVRSDGSEQTATRAYAVSSNGRLSFDLEPFGALTGDGEIFVGADTDLADGEIGFCVGLRR